VVQIYWWETDGCSTGKQIVNSL